MKYRLLILLFVLLPLVLNAQSITVYDGPTLGVDIDTQSSTVNYQGNWHTSGIEWPSYGTNYYWYWLWEGGVETGTMLFQSIVPSIPDPPPGYNENDDQVTILSSECSQPLQIGKKYFLEVQAWILSEVLEASGQSDGVTIGTGDTTPPTVSVNLPAVQSSTTFTVSWTGTDAGSGIDGYAVQSKTGSGSWQNWLTRTTRTSQSFAGNNGQSYSFRVTAYDKAGNSSSAEASTVVNSVGPSLSISATPSSLGFSSGETSKGLTLNITATGGNVTLTSIKEARTYTGWGTEEGAPESAQGSIAGGSTFPLGRTVGLDNIQRAKALGSGSEGSFTLQYIVSGQSSQGVTVSGTITIPVTVSGGIPSSLSIQRVALELPPSPYYAGDIVENARIVLAATGTGTVVGQVLVDGGTGWSSTPSFVATVTGSSSIRITGRLPTESPGIHTVGVQILVPESITVQDTYTVSDQAAPFPPTRLTLVPGVAELFDLKGNATATSNNGQGYEEYVFTGTAKMKFLSLGNVEGGNDLTVNSLVVRYAQNNPGQPIIRGGTVEYDSAEGGLMPIVPFAYGLLQVLAVHYTGNPNTPTDNLVIDAGVSVGGSGLKSLPLPIYDFLIDSLKGLVVKTDGVQAKSYSWSEAQAKQFEVFGVQFRIHDVDANSRALSLGKEAATDRYSISLSGSIAWNEKSGTGTEAKKLTAFRNLSLYSDGSLNASFAFEPSFSVVPDYLALTRCAITEESGTFAMKLGGELRNLPFPLDKLGAVSFEISFDQDGNAQGDVVPVKELQNNFLGHGLGGSDQTEWDLGLATMDLTYLGVHLAFTQGSFDRDHSEVRLGADLYLKLSNLDGSSPADNQKRITFGELDGSGAFTGGIRISMGGGFTWNPPTNAALVTGKKLDLQALVITIDALGIEPSPFKLVFTGGLQLGLEGVEGRVNFENLKIGLDGSLSNLSSAITGGSLKVMDFVSISVGAIAWNPEPSTLTFQADGTTGTGPDRTFAKTDKTVQVKSYFRITGAAINLGGGNTPIMSGGFQELTVYEPLEGDRSFVLKKASLDGFGVTIEADVDYQPPQLRVAGMVKLPSDISATVVGKIGEKNGEPSMGLFVAVAGLNIVVGPGVILTEIGGGIFINPEQQDIDLVKSMARFSGRALLDQKVAAKGPKPEPGSFGIMIVGGAAFAAADIIQARAMVTITANYFNLDAEVNFAQGLVKGDAYLAVGWNPAYAEGAFNVNVDFVKIVKGTGSLEFYVYSDDMWGVMGSVNVALLGADLASAELFVGPPGFMMDAKLSLGLDIGIVSGSITFEGMVWYYTVPDPDTWGAYASVEVKGEILWGLLSASAKIEGALIGSPEFVIYAVGSVKFKVLFITVFNGSIWVSIGSNGIDGGKGRNEDYDGLIDAARHMADTMKEAREQLDEALEAAKLALYQLDEAQQQAAGLALVERSGYLGMITTAMFYSLETVHWGNAIPDNLPLAVRQVWQIVFGPEQEHLVQRRTELANLISAINDGMASLDTYHQAVVQKLAAYQDLLVEPLPSVQDIGSTGNPFQGMRQATVNVRGASRTVTVGFQLDESKASQQRTEYGSVRQGFAQYQDRFIEQAGIIDSKLQELDKIMFQEEKNISSLTSRYADLYTKMGDYLRRFTALQDQNLAYASAAVWSMQTVFDQRFIGGKWVLVFGEEAIQLEMEAKLANTPGPQGMSWNNDRISLINALIAIQRVQGVDAADYAPADDQWLLFIESGKELWYRIPRAGFEAELELAPQRKQAAIDSYVQSVEPFRTKWASASSLIATVFDRKADLYGILYEIYDQLASYGTGSIRVGGSGNVAGIGGMQVQGLAFREVATAGQIASQSVPLPAGAAEPQGLTAGALNPLQMQTQVQGTLQQGQTVAPAAGVGTAWVPVTSYFAGKRQEIGPYLEIPAITGLEGSLTSTNPPDALLTAGFSATHPKGVAEFACKTEPQAGSGAPGGTQMFVPWLAMGDAHQYRDMFFRAQNPPQGMYFFLRVRGAGGKSIERRVTFQLGYTTAASGAPYSSSIVTRDSTPPSTPLVTLAQTMTAEPEQLYAHWGSSDSESGIQRYEYAIGTVGSVSGASSSASGAAAQAETQPVTALESFAQASMPVTGMRTGTGMQTSGGAATQTAALTNVLPWTNAGGRTEANIRGLHLQNGRLYVVSVRATNGVGLTSVGSSESVLVDTSPPTLPQITQFAQTSADGHPNSARFTFAFATDPESGVAAHSFAIGTTAPKTGPAPQGPAGSNDDLFPWTDATTGSGVVANIPTDSAHPLYLLVRAVNNVGLQRVASARLTFTFANPTLPPAPLVVTSPAGFSPDGSRVSIGWNDVADQSSGIVRYEYGLGTTAAAADVIPWKTVPPVAKAYLSGQAAGAAASGFVAAANMNVVGFGMTQPQQAAALLNTTYVKDETGLTLASGSSYYALVKAVNGAGQATIGSAGPLRIDKTPAQASVSTLPGPQNLPRLAFKLTAEDVESGVSAYRWQVWKGTGALGVPWKTSAWTSPSTGTLPPSLDVDVDVAGALGSQLGYNQYYHVVFSVRNGAGLVTAIQGITVYARAVAVMPALPRMRVEVVP